MGNDVHTSQASEHGTPRRDLGVLVGFDGSEHARDALLYGARAAQRNGWPLTVVNAYTVPPMVYGVPAEFSVDDSLRSVSTHILEQAREQLTDYPGEVTYLIERGDAAGAMVRLSPEARLAVVGARGRGGFVGRLLGSVSSALPAHSRCHSVVVPADYATGAPEGAARFDPIDDRSPVVVGMDGSRQGRIALQAAAQAAAGREAPLILSMSVPPPESFNPWYPSAGMTAEATSQRLTELKAELESEAARVKEQFPGLRTSVQVEIGDAVEELARLSESAQLTVVGTRGHGRMVSTLLGSVSRGLLLRAQGPVMVAPSPGE